MKFLIKMVNEGKLLRKKINKNIDEDNIRELNFEGHNLGPLDIQYLISFNLKNLYALNLNNNSILSKGAYYLCQSYLLTWTFKFK